MVARLAIARVLNSDRTMLLGAIVARFATNLPMTHMREIARLLVLNIAMTAETTARGGRKLVRSVTLRALLENTGSESAMHGRERLWRSVAA